MPPQSIVLLPPTHEQSLPAFHVEQELAGDFCAFLREHDIKIKQEPQPLGDVGPAGAAAVEIEVEVDTPQDRLEALREEFLAGR